MGSSLSNLVNNFSEGIYRMNCSDDKKCETCGIKCKFCDCFLECTNFKEDLIEYKCSCCNKNYQHKFNEKLMERFYNTYKFSDNNNNKFISLFRKGVYSNKYMDDWEKFNETLLIEKEDIYSHLNMEDITDADYKHGQRVCKDFEIKNLGEYFDLYLESDALFLADVFENFRNMCSEIYEFDPAKFLSAVRLAWQAAFKKD